METERPRLTVTDPQVMRALAHPARVAIVEFLSNNADGGTATELATVVGLSPSATSYHLRALARFGLAEEAPGRGDARERVWRSATRGFSVASAPSRDPESKAAERDLVTVILDRQDAQLRDWVLRMGDEPAEWQDALAMMSVDLLVTAEELAALNQAYLELVAPYLARNRREDAPAGARPVRALLRSFPTD